MKIINRVLLVFTSAAVITLLINGIIGIINS